MNDTFNTTRFVRLLKKTVFEKPVQMFGFTGLLLAIVFIIYAVAKAIGGFGSAQNLTFIWGLPVSSGFFASIVFGYFSTNASGSSYLTLPASSFEKWLCGILIAGILYPAIFLLFFRVIDSSFVTIFHSSLDRGSPFYKEQYESVYIFDFNGLLAWRVYPVFFLLTGFTFTGSLYFNKIAFIKVAISICILWLGLLGINYLIARLMFPGVTDAAVFNHVTLAVDKEEASIVLPGWAGKIFTYGLGFMLPAILWILSFTRLREKEF